MAESNMQNSVNEAFADLGIESDSGSKPLRFKEDIPKSVTGFLASQASPDNVLAVPGSMAFDVRLAFELALGRVDPNELQRQYEIDDDAWASLLSNPLLKTAVLTIQQEIAEHGVSFRMKAKMLAEASLDTAWLMIHSATTPAAVKQKTIEWLGKMADFEPKNSGPEGTSFNVQINLG